MIVSRDLTSHTYAETTAAKITSAILGDYFTEFATLHTKLESMKQEESA